MQVPGTRARSADAAAAAAGKAYGIRLAAVAAALAVCVWAIGRCSPAEASSGAVHSNSASGINVTIDTRWVDGAGYRPVRITVTPLTPTTTDRMFTVEFLLFRRHWNDDQYDLRVARDVELPAGSGPVEATVLLPRYTDCDGYAVNVLEDGEVEENLCTGLTGFANSPTDWGECLPVLLVVGDTMPDTSQLGALLPLESYVGSQVLRSYNQTQVVPPDVASQMANVLQEYPGAVSRPIAELPQRWLDYFGLDVVCLSLEQLEELADKNPLALKAVLRWTAAGGNLWVYGIGQDWHGVGKLEGLLGLPPGADSNEPVDRGWSKPVDDDYVRPIQSRVIKSGAFLGGYVETFIPDGSVVRTFSNDGSVVVSGGDSSGTTQAAAGKAPSEPHFLFRQYDMGLIVALAPADPFPGTVDEWRGVLNAVGEDRWMWYRRHGVSMVQENTDYWNFLIPGVGLVPVTEFCVLITLFVLAIGPLNYWLLQRWRRLHLLVVTIPLGAGTVTAALFGYALVADGLGTRLRVRSVTRLDQGRGQAVCWARLSYYAGLAPRRGLTFPDDVAVLPLELFPVPDYREGPLRRELIWHEGQGGEQQWFASGWLSSRTPMQLLTVRSRASSLGLDLIALPGDSKGPRVKNRLGTRIKQLVVRLDGREHYWGQDIDVDRVVALRLLTPQDGRELRQGYAKNEPRIPQGLQTRYYRSSGVFGLRSTRWGFGGNPQIVPPLQQSGRLEASLAGLQTLSGANPPLLEPDSYLAVVEECPEVVPGIASAREEASYHVILGKW